MHVADNFDDLSREELVELLQSNGEGRIRISFAGKTTARRIARKVRPRITRTVKPLSIGDPESQAKNLIIEGDNLQGMATLYKERGQVDLILTDPPYNTGNDWRYNDRWDEDPNDPGLGDLVGPEDAGRHTKWMKFMWPRLHMMKAMLKPGGVLAICIDHRELFRLGQMLDELFDEKNRLAILNWQKSYSPRADNRHVSTATEYVLVYAKDEQEAKTGLLPRTEAMNARYTRPDGDKKRWKSGDASGPKAKTHQKMVYGIQSPFTGDIHYPPAGKCWRLEQSQILRILHGWGCEFELRQIDDAEERAQVIGIDPADVPGVPAIVVASDLADARASAEAVLDDGPWPRVYFGKAGTGRPALKNYLSDVKQGKVPMTWWVDPDAPAEEYGSISWPHAESGHSQTGVLELDAILGDHHGFETVKPLTLFQKIIQLWCPEDGLILDPFAGSGTTGHAALALNDATGSERRFILIEQGRPDLEDSYARSLTAERLKRVVSGSWADGKRDALGGGFRFVTLAKKVDAEALLKMERDEMVDTVVASHFDANRRRGAGLTTVEGGSWEYLVAKNSDNEGFFLVWGGPDRNTDLTEDVYIAISEEAQAAKLEPHYHVYARLYVYQTDNVRFYQIPDRILADFGLDLRSEPFAEVD